MHFWKSKAKINRKASEYGQVTVGLFVDSILNGYERIPINTYDTRKQDCGLISKIRDTKQKSNFDKKLISQLVKYGH